MKTKRDYVDRDETPPLHDYSDDELAAMAEIRANMVEEKMDSFLLLTLADRLRHPTPKV